MPRAEDHAHDDEPLGDDPLDAVSEALTNDGTDSADGTVIDLDPDPLSDYVRRMEPQEGVPEVVDTDAALRACAEAISAGTGPIAVDAERASGFRYGQNAYLVQLRREGAGTWLIDPVPLTDLGPLQQALDGPEWVLHAATQDLPCLADLDLHPRALFDTELGSRLAGLHRVGLSAALEYYLGVTLAKEHSAVDWSTRPLPEPWLRYAALDVELLVELRDRLERDLLEQGKLEWARQEFDALTRFTGPRSAADTEPWQRTTGAHRLRKPRNNAALRALWEARDAIARKRDVSSTRVLPDSTLVDLATRMPTLAAGLAAPTPDRSRSRQRRAEQGLLRYQRIWLAAIKQAADLPEEELPAPPARGHNPPPPRAWAERDPAAAERLQQVKGELNALSERLDIPVENLMTPDTVRRVLWHPPRPSSPAAVEDALAELGARPWQRELVGPLLVEALHQHP